MTIKHLIARILFGATIALTGGAPALAQSDQDPVNTLKPKLIESESGDPTIALAYKLAGNLVSSAPFDLSPPDAPFEDARFGSIGLNYEGSGTIAADADDNPTNLVDFGLTLDAMFSDPAAGTFLFGALVRYEADQSFEADQTLFGVHATWGKKGLFGGDNNFLGIDVAYGTVDPGDDKDRLTALGVTELGTYQRFEWEAVYRMPIDQRFIRSIEFNYRYYEEVDAPAAIRTAGSDTHELYGVHLGLINGWFVAYSEGRLPFDRKDDRILEAGWTWNLF